MDMDEVLVNISPYIYRKIRLNWNLFFPYLKDLGMRTDQDIFSRKTFQLTEDIIKDEIKQSPEFARVRGYVINLIHKICFDSNTYDNLLPTKLAQSTLMNPGFIDSPIVSGCYILTRYPLDSPGMLEAKEKFVSKYFTHSKIHFCPIKGRKSKGEALNEMGIDWCVFIDDELKNIRSVAESCDLNRREIILPKMGYNHPMEADLSLLIKEKGGCLSYYSLES